MALSVRPIFFVAPPPMGRVPKKGGTTGKGGAKKRKKAAWTSKYTGVSLEHIYDGKKSKEKKKKCRKSGHRWVAQVYTECDDGVRRIQKVGLYATELEAAVCRDERVRELGLKSALNFSSKEEADAALQAAGIPLIPVPVPTQQRKRANTSSRFWGVCLSTAGKGWITTVSHKGKNEHVGCYKNEVEAAVRRDDRVRERGLPIPLNFSSKEEKDAALQAEGIDELKPLGPKKAVSSSFTGVSWSTEHRRWVANVFIGTKKKWVGNFTNEVEAAVRRDERVRELGLRTRAFNFSSEEEANAALQAALQAASSQAVAPEKPPNSGSRFWGVCWDKSQRRWKPFVCVKGKTVQVGTFTNEVEAAVRRDEKVRELGAKIRTPLNFPSEEAANAALKASKGGDDSDSNSKGGGGVSSLTSLQSNPAVEAALSGIAQAALEMEAEEAAARAATARGAKRRRRHYEAEAATSSSSSSSSSSSAAAAPKRSSSSQRR